MVKEEKVKWEVKEKWDKIILLVTKDQKKELEERAKRAEVSLSSYLRSKLFNGH